MVCLYSAGDIVRRNNLVTKIETWGPEYKIDFKIMLKDTLPTTGNFNLLFFTTESRCSSYRCRIPEVSFRRKGDAPEMFVIRRTNDEIVRHRETLKWNQWYTFTIEQKIMDGKGTIILNKDNFESIWTKPVMEATAYSDVLWYQSSPWHASVADFAVIEYLHVQNNPTK